MCVEAGTTMKATEGSSLMMGALDGFLAFVGRNGRVGFVSEQVEKHLGLTAVDLMSMSVMDLIHNEDQREFMDQFLEDGYTRTVNHRNLTPLMDVADCDDNGSPQGAHRERVFYVRVKCHSAKTGARTNTTGHLLTQWSGRLQYLAPPQEGDSVVVGLVAVVRPVHANPLVEIRLDGNMFMSRHDLGLSFTFCDPRILTLIGYDPDELLGKSTYQFNYPAEALNLHSCHTNLIAKGSCVSKYYRFLGKSGQWVWMKTRATVIYNSGNEPQYVVCLNYVYSEEEGKRCLLLEGGGISASDTNPADYIHIKSLGVKDCGNYGKLIPEPNNNCPLSGFTCGAGTAAVSCTTASATPSGVNSSTPVTIPVSEAVLDHTYPVTPLTSVSHCGELPPGLAASGFPQFVQQNFFDNTTTATLQDTDWSSWLDGLTATLTLDGPTDINALNLNDTMTSTTMVNRDYRLAVSDHDYSAKPESAHDPPGNRGDPVFSNSEGLLLGLDEMMDTDFLDTVSFGRTNYEDSQQQIGLLSGEGLLGGILTKSGLSLADDLDDTNSLLDALSDGHGSYRLQNNGNLSTSDIGAMDGIMSATDSFAAKFAQSLIDEEAKCSTYSFGPTDPCLGVSTLNHLGMTTTTTMAKGGIKNCGLEQNLNQHTLGLVDTPPPSPKPIRNGCKPQYLKLQHVRKVSSGSKSSPSTPVSVKDLSASLSASFSGRSSSQRSSSSASCSSPPHSRSLSKSWPNVGKPSRNRAMAGSLGRQRSAGNGHHSRSGSHRAHTETKSKAPPSLLEQFLTTKQRINPNRGSDNVFQRSRGVTERISNLHIDKDKQAGDQANMLQQLLTGEIDGKRIHQYEQCIIKTRRHDSGPNTPVTSPLTSPLVSDIDLDSDSLTTDTPNLNLFDSSTADMGNFFGALSTDDDDILMDSDLDDILREQTRQEELWLRQYVS